jgi:hypothetical protein
MWPYAFGAATIYTFYLSIYLNMIIYWLMSQSSSSLSRFMTVVAVVLVWITNE